VTWNFLKQIGGALVDEERRPGDCLPREGGIQAPGRRRVPMPSPGHQRATTAGSTKAMTAMATDYLL
jgi:hypothetical protein